MDEFIMLKDLFKEYQDNLRFFFDRIDLNAAERIYSSFLSCRGHIIFTGVGKSGLIAEKLAMTMISTGTKSIYLEPTNALHGDIGIIRSGDLVVCISKSGASEELIKLIPHIKKKGAKTVAWVSNVKSDLLKKCDEGIVLPLIKEICPFGLAPTTSAAIQLIFGDIISVSLMRAKGFGLSEYSLNHPAGSIGKKINIKVEDLMISGSSLPICDPNELLKHALVTITNKQCGCVMITDEERSMHGIFTDGDLRRVLQKDLSIMLNKKMKELMTRSFKYVEPGVLAWEALNIMQKDPNKFIMMLPIIDGDKLIGLIRMHDIVRSGIN